MRRGMLSRALAMLLLGGCVACAQAQASALASAQASMQTSAQTSPRTPARTSAQAQVQARPTPTCPPPPAVAAAVPAQDRGFLWRVSRDGHSSWLFGTLHVGKPAWRRFGPQLNGALRQSDVLALEIDPNDPAAFDGLAETQAPAALPDALQTRLQQAFERACIPSSALAAMHPVLQLTTLTVLEARWLGMDPLYAMEQLLATQMRAQGHGVIALETAAQQKSALLPQDPAEVLRTLDQGLGQLEDRSGRRVLARLAKAWESGDLGALENFEAWCECAASDSERAGLRKLNDERNGPLADGIVAQHSRGLRVFAAVGALHMTGPASLPRLLAQRGFSVERVTFKP